MESIFLIAMGTAFFYFAYKSRLSTHKFAKKGIEVEGVIFDIAPSNNVDSRAYYPLIRFVTAKKEWITEEYGISTMLGGFKKGQKVTVIYNSDNPKEFFVKSPITSLVPIIVLILAIIILAIGVYKLLHIQP